ncbi:MAG TPA: TonB family protein [Gemmatimonadaceae bacterium]|jgi:TonB family protein|nr:TonB family protein [Gemmatimonadaceae bacterium]
MIEPDEEYEKRSEAARGGLHREHVAALIRLATVEQERGRSAEAERLLAEAIGVAEEHLGADDPSLGVALSQLSRLHIRRSDFTGAEPLLARLLQIARKKGDNHPDVATALAGLAAAKHGLRNDIAAEVMYRHALRIREAALAPNHMAIVVTLEQLSETCAARGNVAEAIELLRRALGKRETALGADHASVTALRTRIADLERRAAPAIVPSTTTATPAAPRPPRLPTPSWLASVPSSPKTDATPSPSSTESIETSDDAPLSWPTRSPEDAARAEQFVTLPPSRRRAPRYATVGAALVVLAIAGYGFGTRVASDRGKGGVTNEDASGDFVASAPSGRLEGSAGAPSVVATARVESTSVASPSAASTEGTDVTPPKPKSEPVAEAPAPPAPPALRAVSLSKTAMSNLDSVITTSSKLARTREPQLVATGGALDVSGLGDAGSVTPPVLIGAAPTPRFPDELRAHPIEGEVIVQFRVTEKGRVDLASMQVLQSPHELFTEAVRGILPKFRFEPAHAGLDAKPQAAWVQFRTRFTAKN